MLNQVNKWIDITVPLSNGMPHWPGEPAVTVKRMKSIDEGKSSNVTVLSMSAHTGTHMDAPLHFLKEGMDISRFPSDEMTGDIRVIEIKDRTAAGADELQACNIQPGSRILLKTANSRVRWFEREFSKEYVYLTPAAAELLAEKNVTLVGTDYLSIAKYGQGEEVHKILLGSGIWIIEGLFLQDVSEGIYEMICLPLKLNASDGAPARVLIRKKAGGPQ